MLDDPLAGLLGRLNASGLSWREMSQRSGVPYPTIQRVLSGRTPNPRIKTVVALERMLEDLRRAA